MFLLSVYPLPQLHRLFFAYNDVHVRIILQLDRQSVVEGEVETFNAVYTDDVLAVGTEKLCRVELLFNVVERKVESHRTAIVEIGSRDAVLGNDMVNVIHIEHCVAIACLYKKMLTVGGGFL